MKVLITEDDPITRRLLQAGLTKWGYEVFETTNGNEAWQALQANGAPALALIDWMMPEMDGLELCRKIRRDLNDKPAYLILLTARVDKKDIIQGLQAGADDYVTKPCNMNELRARVQVGERVLRLQMSLAGKIEELQQALNHVRRLQGLFPICSYCKKIRNDKNYWQQIESYISEHSEAEFSHGICPDCYEKYVKPQIAEAHNWKNEKK